MSTLGNRIKYFRKRAKLSQLQLESEIDMSPGSLSRIENDEVNPTKETLKKISNILNLTLKEFDYLNGSISDWVSNQEVNLAVAKVKDYFSEPGVLAYLLDDRWRLVYYSASFAKFLKLNKDQADKSLGKSIIQLLLDDSLGIRNFISKSHFKDILYFQLNRYHDEVSFMEDDESYNETLLFIKNDSDAYNIWQDIEMNKSLHSYYKESREVYFTISGISIKMDYAREPLSLDNRFEVVEYTPSSKVVKFLQKFS